jgi:ferredoxin/flavodoxin---NADP+ reductase
MAYETAQGSCLTASGKNFRIRHKRLLVEGDDGIVLAEVEAPLIARHAQAGQFVIVRTHDHSERIPLTLAAWDRTAGTITLIFQVVGHSTREMAAVEEGATFTDILGPLGTPIAVKKHDHPVICIGGGVGVAPIWPKVKELFELGNEVITIIGARTQRLLILEEELRSISSELIVTTDDGSYGQKGFVTERLREVLAAHDQVISEVIAVGPIPMMDAVVKEMAGKSFRDTFDPTVDYDPRRIPLIVSLNPIMVDGTGMCGGCRVQLWQPSKGQYEARFSCVDGPAFDGYAVDFRTLTRRNRQYLEAERSAREAATAVPGDGDASGTQGEEAGGSR